MHLFLISYWGHSYWITHEAQHENVFTVLGKELWVCLGAYVWYIYSSLRGLSAFSSNLHPIYHLNPCYDLDLKWPPPKPHVFGRWLDYEGIMAGLLLGSAVSSEGVGHCGHYLEGHISLPCSSHHSVSWLPWSEQLLPHYAHLPWTATWAKINSSSFKLCCLVLCPSDKEVTKTLQVTKTHSLPLLMVFISYCISAFFLVLIFIYLFIILLYVFSYIQSTKNSLWMHISFK